VTGHEQRVETLARGWFRVRCGCGWASYWRTTKIAASREAAHHLTTQEGERTR